MTLNSKWLGGLAAFSLLTFTAPAIHADGMRESEMETQETLIPAEEPATAETQQTVLPSDEFEDEYTDKTKDGNVNEDVVTEEDLFKNDKEVQESAVPEGRDTIIVAQPRTAAKPLDNIILELGGGASTFTQDLGDTLEGGAGWTARAVWGARYPVGVELGYMGAVNPVENLGVDDIGDFNDIDTDNSVFMNSAEALARVNFMGARAPVKPFVAGGANYTRFDSNALLDNTEVFAVPLAAGLQFYPMNNFTIGARGEYRILTDWIDNLPDGDQWGGMLTLGANF